MSLTVGSLFSGIGGIDLGLERAGMRVAWQVECDRYARRVLAKNFPGVPCYYDVRKARALFPDGLGTLAPVDVLAGGFPCQDISFAGKGAGIKEGTRSGLWLEFARLIRELRPRYVLVENVPALRSRGLDRVLGDLAASGYDAEWQCLPASAFGALHRRDRLFVVAHAQREFLRVESGRGGGKNGASEALTPQHGAVGHVAQPSRDGWGERCSKPDCDDVTEGHGRPSESSRGGATPRVFPYPLRPGLEEPGDVGGHEGSAGAGLFPASSGNSPWAVEPDVGRVAHGVPSRVDRLRALGNAVVPQVAEFVGRLIVAHAGGGVPCP